MSRAISRYRGAMLFPLLILLEVACLISLTQASSENVFGLLIGLGLLAPFVLPAFILEPRKAALAVPFLVIVPVVFMRFTVAEVVLLLVMFLALLHALASGMRPSALMPAEVLFFLYTLWAAITVSQAVYLPEALGGLKRIIILFLAFIMGARLISSDRALTLIRCLALISIFIGMELWGVIVHSGYPFLFLATRAGILTDLGWGYSNYVAAVTVLCATAGVSLVLYGRFGDRLLGVCSILATAFVCTATISRGGTLALAAALLVATMLELRRRILPALLIIGALGLAYALSPLGMASLARFVEPQELSSVGARIIYYRESFRIFRENWFLGVGPDQIPYHTPEPMAANPHNMLLKNGTDLGVPGLMIYLGIFVALAVSAWRLRRLAMSREERILSLTFLLIVVTALVNSAYEPTLEGSEYGIIFWPAAGCLMMCSQIWGMRADSRSP